MNDLPQDFFLEALQNVWVGVIEFLPQLLLAIIIFIVGWLIGVLLEKLVVHIIEAVKLDALLKSAGLSDIVEKAGYKLHSGMFLGGLVKWFVIIVFLVTALDIVGLSQVNAILTEVAINFLPDVIIAALAILIGSVIAHAVKKAVEGSARAAGVTHAKMLGSIAYAAIWVFVVFIVLDQLGIAPRVIETLIVGFVAMLAIAGGLAFGLGGKDAAADIIKSMRKAIDKK